MKSHANRGVAETARAPGPQTPGAPSAEWLDGLLVGGAPQLDLGTMGRAVNDVIAAVAKQATMLKKARYRRRTVTCPGCQATIDVDYDATAVAKAAAHCAKVTSELTRLSEFAQGRADSRPGGAGRDVLEALTDDGLAFVQALVRGERPALEAVRGWRAG